MVLYYLFTHRQSDAGAREFRFGVESLKYIEDLISMLRSKAYAIVPELNFIVGNAFLWIKVWSDFIVCCRFCCNGNNGLNTLSGKF